ncbi:MAG: DJ-1/PfpI family protein [Gammaproteobacteria bacterium]|nr:MAG: DJ-1/PfpI family protein [Gammaproteobacteria bacterium]
MHIGILIYDEVEVLDFAGPFEVFSTAARLAPDTGITVSLIAGQASPVRARGGFSVLPHHTLHDHPALDVLLIPGGDHRDALNNRTLLDWIGEQAPRVSQLATVCTGIFLLAKALPDWSGPVTTHWEDIPDLRTQFPRLDVKSDTRWVDAGKVISSAGISAGLDMSLYLLRRLTTHALATRTARQMEYA